MDLQINTTAANGRHFNDEVDFTATYLHRLRRIPTPAPKPTFVRESVQPSAPRHSAPVLINGRLVKNPRKTHHSDKLIESAIEAFFEGEMSPVAIAHRFGLRNVTTVLKWISGRHSIAENIIYRRQFKTVPTRLQRDKTYNEQMRSFDEKNTAIA